MGRGPVPCRALTGRRGAGYPLRSWEASFLHLLIEEGARDLNIALLHRDCQQAAAIRQGSGLNFPTG